MPWSPGAIRAGKQILPPWAFCGDGPIARRRRHLSGKVGAIPAPRFVFLEFSNAATRRRKDLLPLCVILVAPAVPFYLPAAGAILGIV